MLNIVTFVLGIVAFLLTSLQVWHVIPRDIPYALIIIAIMEFMWGIKNYKASKKESMKLFVGAVLCSIFCFIWIK